MTGYAKVQRDLGEKKVNIEIKTLNSKQLDLIVKLPAAYRSRELDIRAKTGASIVSVMRGDEKFRNPGPTW